MKTRKKLLYNLALIGAIVILANIASTGLFYRLDFTQDNRYTLSKATKNILRNLKEPVTVTAFFSKDLPPNVAKNRQDFKEMLEEYNAISRGNVVFEFINPSEKPEYEQKAVQKGIQPFLINVREKDQLTQKKAYMGAVIQYGNKEEILPFIPVGGAMEYSLSKAIKKISLENKQTIAFLQGHGEPGRYEMPQLMEEIEVLYNVDFITLNDTVNNLLKYNTLAIVSPRDSFPQTHLEQIRQFLEKGGKLIAAIDRVDGDFQQVRGFPVNTGLESLLESYGIKVENAFLIDAQCANVTVQQQSGFFRMQTQVMFPYLPIITNFNSHPIVSGLESVVLQFASPLNFIGDTTQVVYTPLMVSSANANTHPSTTYFDVQRRWTKNDFPRKSIVAGALIESKNSAKPFKMVVFGDGNFAVNGSEQKAQQQQPDNINLFANALDYLSDDTGLILLRTKSITDRPLENIEDGKKAFLKYLNFLLPILLILFYGIYRLQRRKIMRIKRMQKNFVD